MKWRLRNDCRNYILMTSHHQDLGSASDWSSRVGNLLQLIKSTTHIWIVTRHQYGISAPVFETLFRGETRGRLMSAVFSDFSFFILIESKEHVEKHHSHIDPITFCFPFCSFPAVDIWTMWIWEDLPTVNLIVWPSSSKLSRTGSKCISFCSRCCNPGRYL